jgi:hypothetical protein
MIIGSSASYITRNDLTSHATFYGLTFANTPGRDKLFNVKVLGSNTGGWRMAGWYGDRGGADYESDSGHFVNWDSAPVQGPQLCTSQATGNWHSAGTWDCGIIPRAVDTAIVATGFVVTSTGAVSVASVTVAGILDLDGTNAAVPFTIANAGKLVNHGTVRVTNSANAVTLQGATGGSMTIEGSSVTLNGRKLYVARTTSVSSMTVLSGETLELAGDTTFYWLSVQAGGSFIQGTNNNLVLMSSSTFATGTFTKDSGTGVVRIRGTSGLHSNNQDLGNVRIGAGPL